jgi:hypothetical protein
MDLPLDSKLGVWESGCTVDALRGVDSFIVTGVKSAILSCTEGTASLPVLTDFTLISLNLRRS